MNSIYNTKKYTWKILPFQDLTVKEFHDIIKLRVDIFVVEQECAYEELDGKDPLCYHIFCKDEIGRIIAAARIAPERIIYEEASIGRVVTLKTERKNGLGRILMELSMNFCREELGCESLKIAAQLYLRPFYESLGFDAISEIYLWDGIEHVDMRLTFNKVY